MLVELSSGRKHIKQNGIIVHLTDNDIQSNTIVRQEDSYDGIVDFPEFQPFITLPINTSEVNFLQNPSQHKQSRALLTNTLFLNRDPILFRFILNNLRDAQQTVLDQGHQQAASTQGSGGVIACTQAQLQVEMQIIFNRFQSFIREYNHRITFCNLPILILQQFWKALSNDFYAVSGDSYYVGTTGDDSNSCSQTDQCLTLEQGILRESANSATDYTVFIMDKTTLSSRFSIYLSFEQPRTFTNNPQSGSILSEIQVNIKGLFAISEKTVFLNINFTMLDVVQNEYGGVIYIQFYQSYNTLDITSCTFIGCNASGSGGALYLVISNSAQTILSNLTFNHCEAQYNGGAIFANLLSGGKLTIAGSCSITECKTYQNYGSGGGIYASIRDEDSQLILEDSITFEKCFSNNGGGMYLGVYSYGQVIMNVSCIFKDCTCTYSGGGCFINASNTSFNIQLLGNMQFEGCTTGNSGGGFSLSCRYTGQITINEMQFTNCNATESGGGFSSSLDSGAQITITGKIRFDNCHSQTDSGGGQYLIANGSGCIVNITGEFEYNQCNATSGGGLYCEIYDYAIVEINNASLIDCNSEKGGGGIYCSIINQGQVQVNNIKLMNCNSQGDGGGIFSNVSSGGQLILDKSCQFYQCESYGNGGGIYINIDSTAQCSFIIKDAFIHDCKALNNTNSSLQYSRSGFGGGLFLGVNGDYSPSSKLINLHGMKIYNNLADKNGQSLYVVMTQIVEFCKYGILGEYVKGNYSDTYSDESDLEGIPMDLSTFNSSTSEQIRQQQKPLEPLWRILGILKSAQVVVNISNPNGKLIFHIEGQRMIQGYLNVKIFELRDKTQEEIDLDQKEIKYKYNMNKLKSLKRTQLKSSIILQHQPGNKQQISISSDSRIEKNLRNYDNEIIYPLEDGSSNPISIEGEIQSEQKASFEMNDGSWFNNKQKVYGVLISNDRKIFTGKDGHDIEEDENAAVQLEVTFKEEEGKGFPIGVIVGIAVGALAIVAVIIIVIIVAVFISKKKKAKKPASSYGPEMRARNLPMENKFPQNSHSLDAMNKAMESNNW
ncbi:MAG: hypothetical protein EZS28_014196 [Streblomastix strix]|uniref:Uncharacterized protein n=1 Tax=Streblomastix strix TaxID=222440 RepID=A0A5J4W5W2_9EUKA|nr:MAG: hypothetical protein EZS28_014196 [Streblomastix strix]